MQLARVVGTVVATRKDEKMVGVPFLVLQDLDLENRPAGGSIIAADPIGAARDEVVLYSKGSSARQTEITRDRPNDAVICGIVDQWEVGGEEKYRKV
ncbi:MAG: EutN/CcmL family microcompartment protein [Candidatus Erginobacter occultus]|jgi:microcompartment protein CcmK/EutM|nr:EutN/CcmL family microcompartment protein [Candidatus Erginobacter occultus]